MAARKVLMVGPYPPPEGGWSTAIREEREELEKRGIECKVLNLGVNRRISSDRYICIDNPADLLFKLIRFGFSRYLFRLHMNGDSPKGIAIVIAAEIICTIFLRRSCLSFHAGVDQANFPHRGNIILGAVWILVFNLAGTVICDNDDVREMIIRYRIQKVGVYGISPFSSRRISYREAELSDETKEFISNHEPLIFSYFAYRPEYRLEDLFDVLKRLKKQFNKIGLIAVDDRAYPDPVIEEYVLEYKVDAELEDSLLFTGSLDQDRFLTLLGRTDLYLRTPVTDGVCSSVLESLYMKVPVVAVENGSRPEGVVTYKQGDIDDMFSVLTGAIEGIDELKDSLEAVSIEAEDSVSTLCDLIEERCLS